MAKKLTAAELKKCLRDTSWNQLEGMLCTLYRDSDQAKLYFNSVFNPGAAESELLDGYEKKLRACFVISNPRSPDTREGKRLVREAEKLGSTRVALKVMLRFVEMGTEFTNNYGDIDGPFYDSLTNVFGRFVALLNSTDEETYLELADRIERVVAESADIGWGYTDEMRTLYGEIDWADGTAP
ncbi:MAG: DUF6155 family protein [Clostridiales bacterium]|nr:DUF6155 family protein [Clostridiales bacterium]